MDQPKNKPVSETVQRALNALILQAKAAGINSFSLCFRDPATGDMITHTENMPASDAVNLAGQLWKSAMAQAAEKTPDLKLKKIFANSVIAYDDLATNINKKVEKALAALAAKQKPHAKD